MTSSQPRGIPGFQPSASQNIPTRFSNQSPYNPGQAYSPRHMVPSSSPHQSAPYFQQGGHPGGPHDMYKGPGTGVAGTPPVMQQYLNGGHRQRGPMSQVQTGGRNFFYPMPPRFSGMQGHTGPPGAFQYQYPSQAPYHQYVQHPQMTQQQVQYSPASYSPQFPQQPPQQQQIGPSPVQTVMSQQPPTGQKREKKIIRIVDPNTNQDVTEDIIKGSGSRQDSLSTPPSGRSSATPPQGDVAAKFAAQVAVAAGTSKSASPLITPPIDTQSVLIPSNQQNMMHQMSEQQIVGSPSMSVPMMPPGQTFMNMPGQAPSPRPPSVSPQTQQTMVPTPQQFAQMQGQVSQPSSQMLSASPGHIVTHPQMQHSQIGMPPMLQDQMPQAGYQLTQQFEGSSPASMQRNIPPEGSYLSHTAHVNAASGEPSPLQQPPQLQAGTALTRPAVQQQRSPPAVQAVQTPMPSVAKDIPHSEPAPSHPVVPIRASTPPVAAQEEIKDQSEKSVPQIDPVPSKAQSEGAIDADIAAIATEHVGDDTSVAETSKSMTKAADEKPDKPVDQVPSKPEKTEQEQVKEDTAIRLEDQNDSSVPLETDEPLISDDVKSTKDIDLPMTAAETDKKVDTMPEIAPPPKVSQTEPANSKGAPVVNIVPATPPVKVKPPQPQVEEKSATVPPKEDTGMSEEKTKSPLPETKTNVQTELVEKQQQKPRMKSPEPQKQQTSDVNEGKTTKKDSSSSENQQKTAVSKTPNTQKVAEKTVVNGLDSSTESEAGKDKKKTEEGQPDKPAKTADVKPGADSNTRHSKSETARSPSVSSEKTSEKSQEFEETNGVAPGKSKASDIKYEDDQWSPLNPKGKRQYDSNFLLQFQYKPTSLEKPKDLPDIDIVLQQPHNQKAAPIQAYSGADFTPPYMRGQARRPGRQNSRDHHYNRMGNRSSMSGPGQRVIQKVVSIDRDVELKTTENAWKPIKRDKNLTKVPADEMETLEVIREVRSILNKLTPSTFSTLMQQVLALKIDTEKKLRGTINLIFEKAIDEPNFSEAYANMCRQMTQIRVTPTEPANSDQSPPGPSASTVEFRKLLLTQCQREFEKNKSDQEHLLEMKKKMEENKDAELATQLKEEYELAEYKERRRTLGNIRFIGELFKLRMLTESIMHNCIMTLFKARDDDHLESLCRLLTTIGKDLDHVKGKQRMDQYFDQILKIIQEKRTSSRVRFMLQDVHDLRLNNWVPRAIVTQGPKTISQIHQDAKQEQELLQLKLATTAAPPPMKQGGRQQNRMGSRGHGEDGWTKVQTPAKPTRYDPNKMKLKPNQFDESKVTLGPSRAFTGWKSGSAGSGLSKTGSGGYSPSGSMERTQETGRSNTPTNTKNRFSALSQGQGPDYDGQRRHHGRQSSRDGNRTGSRGSMGPPSSGGRTPRKDERSSVLEATRKITSVERGQETRQRLSRESSPSVRPTTPQQQPTAHKYNTSITEEIMQQKGKNILEEFLSIVDFKEATECIEELNAPPSMMHALVYIAHEFTLEKKKEERVNVGRLMAHLLKRGRLSVEQYMKGLAELLEMGSDYEIDVPKVWEYFAEQLSPVFEDDKDAEVPLSCLAELASPLREEGKSGIFVAEVVKAIVKQTTMEVFVQKWQRSDMLWSNIISKDDEPVDKFLSLHNLSELLDSKGPSRDQSAAWQPPARPTAADEQYRLEQDIKKLLDDRVPNDDIFAWVEKNVQKENLAKPPFLRALTIAVCKKALDKKDRIYVDEERISERGLVLKKFMDGDPERELQALYSLQQLMVILEQPANVLRKFFDVLYNEDVISEQTFYKWEKSDDPNEQEGKGVAVHSVNPFFTWLRTAEPESD